MTPKFNIAVNYVLENEGGLNTDKTDLGGITNFGISSKFIESLDDKYYLPTTAYSRGTRESKEIGTFYVLHVKQSFGIRHYIEYLTKESAKWIYQKYFWLPIYEKINNQDICNFIFDMHVQHGKRKTVELIQRAINAANDKRVLAIDGNFGNKTLEELNYYDNYYSRVKSCLIAVRESLFRCIVAHDKTQENKLEGWLKRCYR